MDVLITGVADSEIRKNVLSLSWSELDVKSDNEIVAFVESKEVAKNAWNSTPTAAVAGMLSYKKTAKPISSSTDHSTRMKLSLNRVPYTGGGGGHAPHFFPKHHKILSIANGPPLPPPTLFILASCPPLPTLKSCRGPC